MRIRHIRDRLIFAGIILIIPFVLLSVVMQIARFKENRRNAIYSQFECARDIASDTANYIRDVVAIERTIGLTFWGEYKIPSDEASKYAARAVDGIPELMHMAVADVNGVIFASDMQPLIGHDASRHPSIRRIIQGDEWAVSNVFVPRIVGRPMIAISTGIRDEKGGLRGVIIAITDEDHLESALRSALDRAEGGQVVIVDSNGVVALEYGPAELEWPERRWSKFHYIRQALAGKPVMVESFKMPDGQLMLGSVVPMPEIGWAAAVFTPRENIIGPVRRQTVLRGLMVMAIVLLAMGLATYFGNKLAKPALDLSRVARELERGNLQARAGIRTGDELELLGNSFNEMAAALQERTSALNSALESQQRLGERASTLYAVAQGLIVTMPLDERLEIIARSLASICEARRSAIFLRRGDRLLPAASWGPLDPKEFGSVTIDIGESGRLVYESLVPGTPVSISDAREDSRVDPELAAKFNLRGLLALPLVRRNQVVGLALLDNPGEPLRFDSETVDVARGFAALAAIAIENAETFEKWSNIAQTFQKSLLPEVCNRMGDFEIACKYHAAMEMPQLGGDFYDLIPFPDGRVGIVIADVSGKGLEAAVLTAMGKYTLRAFACEDPSPGRTLTRANTALTQAGESWGFVTMFYGLLDTKSGRMLYSNGGHPPCLLVRPSGEILCIPSAEQQPPVGIFGAIEYHESELCIAEGDMLVGYTDGVIEARRDGELFEMERLAHTVGESRHMSSEGVANFVYQAVVEYSRGRLQDDIAFLVIKHKQV